MIRYAYSRKIPIQIFMTSGYDNVVNEKRFRSEWGETGVNYKGLRLLHLTIYWVLIKDLFFDFIENFIQPLYDFM